MSSNLLCQVKGQFILKRSTHHGRKVKWIPAIPIVRFFLTCRMQHAASSTNENRELSKFQLSIKKSIYLIMRKHDLYSYFHGSMYSYFHGSMNWNDLCSVLRVSMNWPLFIRVSDVFVGRSTWNLECVWSFYCSSLKVSFVISHQLITRGYYHGRPRLRTREGTSPLNFSRLM